MGMPMTEDGTDVFTDTLVNHIGRLLRQERQKRCSIEQLAKASGVSAGLISQIERGIGNPSIGNLWKLAAALEVPLGRFFLNGGMGDSNEGLVRAADRPTLPLSQQAVVYQILTPTDSAIQMIHATIPPGFDNSDSPFVHEGSEVLHVLDGVLAVSVGPRAYEMHSGDTLSFRASEPHWYRTIGARSVTAVGAVSPPHVSVNVAHGTAPGDD